MTDAEIDAMEAGREMDALIAEKMMGWIWSVEVWTYTTPPYKYGQRLRYLRDLDRCACAEKWNGKEEMPVEAQPEEYQCPNYSTDIAAAWQVVEKLTCATKQWFRLDQHSTGCTANFQNGAYPAYDIEADADTAPLAICRAALQCCKYVADKKEDAEIASSVVELNPHRN